MAELDAAFHEFDQLHRVLMEPEDLEATLDRIVSLSVDGVPGCEQASMTVATDGPITAAHSGPDVLALDEIQYQAGGGPCVHAYEVREHVSLPDIGADDRWPAFRDEALRRGMRSSLSYPMMAEDRSLGSINLYGSTVGAFYERSDRAAVLFAEQGAIALVNAVNAAKLAKLADEMRAAMRHRDVIGQAKGILMNQRKITAGAAFEILCEASQRQNRKLRDLAGDLTTTGELP